MNQPAMLRFSSSLSLCSTLLFAGCATLSEKPASVPYHQLYQEIENPAALRFLGDGIAYLEAHYAPFEFPVTEVYLLHSRRNEIGRSYKIAEGFSKTEIVHREAGICAIYIAVPPGDPEFFPLLAHEIGHLKAPSIENWAMEGFCMVFSEELCAHLGVDWSHWKERFTRESDDPYARAYWRAIDSSPTRTGPQ